MANSRLILEHLEHREVPSTSAVTWPDGRHLTLSFAPDGTKVASSTNKLHQTLDPIAPTAVWQREIARAFQTWAAVANINVGVVPDGGQDFGTSGAVQGDTRFGDIRIAAVPMPTGTLITNTAFQWSGTTWSGDVVINSTCQFSVGTPSKGVDLYTAMLNEAGNVFGVLDSHTDTNSGVYYQYVGPKSGIDAANVTDIESLYGGRSVDSYDAAGGNGSFSSATNLGLLLTGTQLQADVTTTTDTDYYKFTEPLIILPISAMEVRVNTSGVSMLAPDVKVYNSNHVLVGSATATDPLNGNVSVLITGGLFGGTTYYVRVAGAVPGAFGIGGYGLAIGYHLLDGSVTASLLPGLTGVLVSTEVSLNNLIATATELPSLLINGNKPDARFDYTYDASIASAQDVDFYKVKAPSVAIGPQKLNVLIWGREAGGLFPMAQVFSASSQPIASTLLANENGTYSLEMANVTAGATYYVEVSALNPSGSHNTGNYFLGVDFNTEPTTVLQSYASGTLTPTVNQKTQALVVTQNRLYEFILSAAGVASMEVQMDILDASGNVIFTLRTYAGQPASTGHIYLRAGNYTTRYTAIAQSGPLQSVTYLLKGRIISDPIGPQKAPTSPGTIWDPNTQNSAQNGWDSPYYG